MSRFQATVSTIAALSTIAVTAVTAYKVFSNQQQNSLKQQLVIEDLKHQLANKQLQTQTTTTTPQVQTQPTQVYNPPVVNNVPAPPPLPPSDNK